MIIHDMGDGLLVQLDKVDITNLNYSILELKISSGLGSESHVKKWLVPFLQYLYAETGETNG